MADYVVDSLFQIKSNLPEFFRQLTSGFQEVDRLIGTAKGSVVAFASEFKDLASGSKGIAGLVRNLEKIKLPAGVMTEMRELRTVTDELARAQSTMASDAKEAARAWQEMAEAARRVKMPTIPATGGKGGGGHGGHGGSVHAVDAIMGAQTLGSGTSYLWESLHASAETKHNLAVISGDTRITPQDLATVRARAEELTRSVQGSTIGGNLEIANDLKNTFGSLDEALSGLKPFVELVTTLQIMDRSHGGAGELRQALNTAKFIEDQGGAIDPKNPGKYDLGRFQSIAANLVAIDVATGGRVDPASMLAFQKMARTGGMMMSDHALYGETPYFANAFGASKLGTALFSDVQVMLGGRLMKEHEQELEDYGVIKKGSGRYVKEKGPGGKPKYEWEYDPNGLKGRDVLATDVYKWIHDILAPAIIAKDHLDVSKPADLNKLLLTLTQLAQRGTQAGLWADAYRGYGPAQKEAANIGAQNTNMLAHFMATDPTAQMLVFKAAENSLMVTLGDLAMGPALDGLKALTGALQGFTDWAKKNPGLAKELVLIGGGMTLLSSAAGNLAMTIYMTSPLVQGMGQLAKAVLPFGKGGASGAALATLAAESGAGSLGGLGLAIVGLAATLAGLAWATKLPDGTRFVGGAKGGSKGGGHFETQNSDGTWSPSAPPKSSIETWWQGFRDAPAAAPGVNAHRGSLPQMAPTPAAPAPDIHLTVPLNVDGKTLAKAVVKYQNGRIVNSAVATGTTGFDVSHSPYPAAVPTGGHL